MAVSVTPALEGYVPDPSKLFGVKGPYVPDFALHDPDMLKEMYMSYLQRSQEFQRYIQDKHIDHRFSCYEKPPKTHDLESPKMMSVRP